MNAPLVIAKGADRVAARIRALAKDHYVPLYENPPLARLLYASLKVNQEIFPEHYKAVAEVMRYVMHIRDT
jgi:flagellar biosynthetic protein FlhB